MKKKVTASELMTRLNADPDYVARKKGQDEAFQRKEQEYARAETPLVEELRTAGVNVGSVWDLVNTTNTYTQSLPILLNHLHRAYPDAIRDGIARALAMPSAKFAWPVLVRLFRYEKGKRTKDGLAVAISNIADDVVIDELIALARDVEHGESRTLLLSALERSQLPQARKALMELGVDAQLHKEVQVMLRRVKSSRTGRRRGQNVVSTGTVSMRFLDAAKQAFSFLEDAGFHLSQRDSGRLQYETAQIFVTIKWDARSGELDVFIGLQPKKRQPRDSFSLRDVLAMEGVDLPEGKMPFQVAEESQLGPFLHKLAEDTRVHAQLALAGDRMFFHRLKAFRNAQARTLMLDMELRRVRAEADKAWQKRELDKLIGLYTSIENQLTASEKAKLAYAKKHQSH